MTSPITDEQREDPGLLDLAIELWAQDAWARGLQDSDPEFDADKWLAIAAHLEAAQAKVAVKTLAERRAA